MIWLISTLGVTLLIVFAITSIVGRRRLRAKERRSYRRHRKIVAYQRAWDWLFRHKNQQLTYQPKDEGEQR